MVRRPKDWGKELVKELHSKRVANNRLEQGLLQVSKLERLLKPLDVTLSVKGGAR